MVLLLILFMLGVGFYGLLYFAFEVVVLDQDIGSFYAVVFAYIGIPWGGIMVVDVIVEKATND